MRPSPPPRLFDREVRRIHCVGVAGMGLGPLALYLAQLGFEVSGEDDGAAGAMGDILRGGGVALRSLPPEADLLVYSSAIPASHPARLAAQARGLAVVRRGELLAEVVRERRLVAVCGSHGKTTTTAMLVTALRRARFPAGYILGGLFNDATPPARVGSNDWVVAEVDESDGTIDRFSPAIAVVVNLDWDHPDHYQEPADLEATFAALLARTRCVLLSDSCPQSGRIVADRVSRGDTPEAFANWSFGRTGDFTGGVAREDAGGLVLELGGRFGLASARVRALGEFNGANALAALAAAQLMGVKVAPDLLADFPGVRRRQAILGVHGGVTAIEDYAHHPAEIRALLGSLRRTTGGPGRLLAVFQPHRYSRTAQFKSEFAAALAAADGVSLLDVYGAGEPPVAGGTTADIYAELKQIAPNLPVRYVPGGATEVFQALGREVRAGDRVVFVGAGDIDRMARNWFATLSAAVADRPPWDELVAWLRPQLAPETRLTREEPLAVKTTLRVGGAARVFVEPASVTDLATVFRTARERGIRVHLLGRGSNLVVPDQGVDGIVVGLGHASWAVFEPRDDGTVWAGAGLRLKNLCGLATRAGLAGFEFMEGIPGSVGGALRMNAGAMGGWIFDVVEEVQLMSLDGEVRTLPRSAMHVDYRFCGELQEAVALGARLRPGTRSESDAIARQIDVYRRKRHETQPREPSAGCIFRNPPGTSAGRLIDESGLKGARVGGAEVSTVHANFIVNRGGATGDDVLELVRRIRARVREAKGVELEPEVLLFGRRWEDVL